MSYSFIQLALHPHLRDVFGDAIAQRCQQFLNINTGKIKSSRVFVVDYHLNNHQLTAFSNACLYDEVMNTQYINSLLIPEGYGSYIAVAKLPGVTDDEGASAQKALADFLNVPLDTNTQHIYTQYIYYFEQPLTRPQLKKIAEELLGNKLINHFQYDSLSAINDLQTAKLYVPKVKLAADLTVKDISLNLTDPELLDLSRKMLLALSLDEMKAIQAWFANTTTVQQRLAAGLPANPTDCELEILAQTWSEHSKHKEFNAIIHYTNHVTNQKQTIKSLFKTYIKGATDAVTASLKANNNNWLVKVFTDNAGVVRLNPEQLFVWKVETHNSPSALDPYGGAITGILGNNRDPLGTGVGGARLLFNTNVLCFGNPFFSGKLLTGQLHPKRIFEGVVKGIEDGGNKSGIPTVNGSIVFDDRFSGKPLVYCGTGALLKPDYHGLPTWEKPIATNDRILMGGGRVGKDGIHGATFSSIEIDEHSPASAVQIGSPITQKLLNDFLIKACEAGLVKCSTDNGAGGLSSSIGELATISGGALVNLEKVPLKYSGLRPWEIFLSESQERMTIVADPEKVPALLSLAAHMEVELTDIGCFTNSGNLEVRFNNNLLALLSLEFLHDGVPQKILEAEWQQPQLIEPQIPDNENYNEVLLRLMGSLNICSREAIIRQYDHEVKGRTVIKPLMGAQGKAPQDAAVVRTHFEHYEGVAVSNGILPRYGDIDAYQMSAGAFDEAVRQIIAVGGLLPNRSADDGIAWSVNDNFCVPDSVYHPETNPDGKLKLAKLVQMCQALYDMAVFFDIPLTSGKDSMKNDFKADGVKISVPPTILYSMVAKIPDIRKTVTSYFKASGDLIYQLGETYNELGASEYYALHGYLGANLPIVRPNNAKDLYQMVMRANAKGLIQNCHDLSDGGLMVALTECTFGGLGAKIEVSGLLNTNQDVNLQAILFAESHSRFVVSVAPAHQISFEAIMGKRAILLGQVTAQPQLIVTCQNTTCIDLPTEALLHAWDAGLGL
ncbi:MAG: phosphoribosylformylglycinamidine synthase [Sphingobacteriales bacterium]|nr:phosphoribosylformylglycinamidine synthase [Sphingobacteriales bacterium]